MKSFFTRKFVSFVLILILSFTFMPIVNVTAQNGIVTATQEVGYEFTNISNGNVTINIKGASISTSYLANGKSSSSTNNSSVQSTISVGERRVIYAYNTDSIEIVYPAESVTVKNLSTDEIETSNLPTTPDSVTTPIKDSDLFVPVTEEQQVNLTSDNSTAVISEPVPEGAQYVGVIYKDGNYYFTEIAVEDNEVSVMVHNGDVYQIMKIAKDVESDVAIPSYVSSDYLNYISQKENGTNIGYDGVIPSPIPSPGSSKKSSADITLTGVFNKVALSMLSGVKAVLAVSDVSSYPAKYDPRNEVFIPTIKDQGQTNLCWDFSSISAMETLYGKVNNMRYDFSESNLAYTVSNKSKNGYSRGPLDAGNFIMSAAYMSRGEGPVLETDDPFANLLNNKPVSNAPVTARLTDWDKIPYDINTVKGYITEYGSVVSCMHISLVEWSGKDFYKKSAFYTSDTSAIGNHAIQIIGWDDNYAVSNFDVAPPYKGAWIIKNSWGEKFGDNGYYYISYADAPISETIYAVTGVAPADKYDNFYMYDPYGEVSRVNFNTSSIWFANVFNANRSGEKLSAVSFYNSHASASYEIYISQSGNLNERTQIASGTLKNAGYFTIDLATPIVIENPEFSIIVKFTTSEIASAPLQRNSAGWVENSVASNGISFISSRGVSWIDAFDRSAVVCIRAHTTNAKDESAALSYHKVILNGIEVDLEAYFINGFNHFKLRDLAFILNGTNKQFSVDWKGEINTIVLTKGKAYSPVGDELVKRGLDAKLARPTTSAIMLDGSYAKFTAFNIGGYNYFKLRDVMNAMDVYVGFDDKTGTIILDTSRGYVD